MRLKLNLTCRPGATLPLNNRYELSAIIYKILSKSNPEFSEWLHDKGYGVDGRNFKLFTFGHLATYPYDRVGHNIVTRSGQIEFHISFLVEEMVSTFVAGLFQDQQFGLGNAELRTVDMRIENVEILPTPTFTETMRYTCHTPILLSEQFSDTKHKTYISPLDEGYESIFLHNLLGKVIAADRNIELPTGSFRALTPPQYIQSKPVWIHKPSLKKPIMLRPFAFDFELTAPRAWHEVGYFAGFGAECSMGLG
jgi:CRISPR-associated endoribonuclease Cas6